jgi:hypothetical protein
MLERICAECRHSNPIEETVCQNCHRALRSVALVRKKEQPIVVSSRKMPAIYVPAPVKKAAAVGLAGVVVNAGINYLRRRLTQPTNKLIKQSDTNIPNKQTTVVAQRITEIWRRGQLRERTIESIAIHKDEPN